jgi:V/A-type H+-transporting ATPase subunit I
VTLPNRRGTPAEEMQRIDRAIIKEREKIERREARAIELTKHLPKLKMVADYMYWQKQKHNVISRSVMTNDTLVFEGWVPKNHIVDVRNSIANKTELFALEEIEAAEDEIPPVEIENNAIVKPFESITRLYGLPGTTDIDPTPYLAGFFFVFFGVALSDAGYGLVLATLTGALLWRYRIRGGAQTLMRVLFLGGISTFFVGLLFGGYFGIDPSTLPAPLKAIQAFDPIQNPLPVFYLSLGLGVIHVLTGLALGIVREAKRGNIIDGILDKAPWIAMFISLILFVGYKIELLAGSADMYNLFIFTSLFAIIITQGRKAKNPFMKLLKGVLSLYNSIQYFSDILSYSRLLALGLATSALALAVNIIADLINNAVPIVGPILMVAILIGGHIFNLGINILGAFIHSARLQFIEFFSKFIIGSGKQYKPFKRQERYVVIE